MRVACVNDWLLDDRTMNIFITLIMSTTTNNNCLYVACFACGYPLIVIIIDMGEIEIGQSRRFPEGAGGRKLLSSASRSKPIATSFVSQELGGGKILREIRATLAWANPPSDQSEPTARILWD